MKMVVDMINSQLDEKIPDTFQPHNGTQTSVLILQKKFPDEIFAEERHGIDDYEIFMAQVEKVGHDKRGNSTFRRDNDGNEILIDGEKILDDETAEVARVYSSWKKKLHLDTPVKCCSVKISDVRAHSLRLEASVFDVSAMNARKIVTNGKFPAVKLQNLIDSAYICGRFKRIWVNKSDLPIYQPSAVTELRPKPDDYISAKTATDIDALRVHAGQVLLTCSGTIGKVSFVTKTLDEKIFSHDLLRINAENAAGYVYAYLKSSIGQKILLTNSYGAVIEHIEPEHLENIPIPDAPDALKQKIHGLIVRSYELRDESNALIDEAEKILLDELNLPPIEDFQGEKIFSVKLSSLRGRLDASFHAPIVEKIVEHLKIHAAEVTNVADSRISTAVILPGRFKRVYVDENHGVPFFSGRNIGELDPNDKKYLSLTQHSKNFRDTLTIRENMILVTCSGTIGNVALVPKHWDGWAMTHDIIRLSTPETLAGYVFIWLQSIYAGEIIKSFGYGAVVRHIEKFHLETVPVPLLKSLDAQSKINSLALTANEKRFEAYRLEQDALKALDEIFS